MEKTIPTYIKILFYLLLILLILPLAIFFALQIPPLQKSISNKITSTLTKSLNTTVLVDRVSYSIDNRLVIKGIYVEDYNLDTLFYLKKASFWIWELFGNQVNFNTIFINGLKVRINEDTTGMTNLLYFIKNLPHSPPNQKKKKNNKAFDFLIKKIHIKNCDIAYYKQLDSLTPNKFNPKYFRIYPLNFTVENLEGKDSTYSLELYDLNFKDEESGFSIKNISGKFYLGPKELRIKDFETDLTKTKIKLNDLSITYDSLKELSTPNKLNFFVDLDTSTTISTEDLKYFIPQLAKYKSAIKIGYVIYGNLGDINIRPFYFQFGKHTRLEFNGRILGLPDRDKLYFDIELDTFQTRLSDFALLRDSTGKPVFQLPKQIYKVSFANAQARVTGFLKDLSAYLKLNSNLGTIVVNTDLKLGLNQQAQGYILAKDINLNKILENEKLKNISFSDTFRIGKQDTLLWGDNTLNINSLYFNNYTYHNIKLQVAFTQKHAFVDLYLNDSNLVSTLDAELYLDKTPKTNFSLIISKANLYNLHFDKDDPQASIKLGLDASLQGNNINNLTGTVKLSKPLVYIKYLEKLEIKNFYFRTRNYYTKNNIPYKSLNIKSDLFDLDITGNYELSEFKNYTTNFISQYLPATLSTSDTLILTPTPTTVLNKGNIEGKIILKNLTPVTRIFAPAIQLANNSKINFKYYDKTRSLIFNFYSDSINLGNNVIIRPQLSINTDTSLHFIYKAKNISAGPIKFDSLKLAASAANNHIYYTFSWHNNTQAKNYGFIEGATTLSRNDSLFTTSKIKSDSIYINDFLWKISKLNLDLCKKNIKINGKLTNPSENQIIKIFGNLTTNPNDSLLITIKNFDISQFNSLLKNIKLSGRLNGYNIIKNIFDKPLIISNNTVSNLKVNGVNLQLLQAYSDFDAKNNIVNFKITTEKPNKIDSLAEKYVQTAGSYHLDSKKYLVKIKFQKFKLIALYPYFEKIVSAVSRYTTIDGLITLAGQGKNLDLKGDVNLTNGTFKLRPTNVVYTINQKMQIHLTNDSIIIDTTTFISQGGTGKGKLWGLIYKNKFGDYIYDVHFVPDSLLILNLPPDIASSYYGKASVSGNLNINGLGNSISLNADIKTEANTDLTFKINSQKTFKLQTNFIKFINTTDTTQILKPANPKKKKSNLDINVNLGINPESKFTIVIDEQTGDKLTVQGNGLLNIKVTPYGNLMLYGTLTIDQGDYFFSLENIITKKFSIQPGSTIKWSGSPTDAQLNLTAVYDLRNVNLYDLTLDDNYWNERTEVKCLIIIKGTLEKPELAFDLDLPKADQRITSQIKNLDKAEKIKQVLSLLVLGKFQPLPGLEFNPNQFANTMYATDILSSQLSNLLSKLDENLELGVNYQGGQKVNVAVSYKLWNERVTIKTDVGIGNENTNQPQNQLQQPIVGEGEIDVKLNKKGNLKLKIYNQANRNEFFDKGPYTQGIGIYYQKDFSNLFPWLNKKNRHKRDSLKNKKQ